MKNDSTQPAMVPMASEAFGLAPIRPAISEKAIMAMNTISGLRETRCSSPSETPTDLNRVSAPSAARMMPSQNGKYPGPMRAPVPML